MTTIEITIQPNGLFHYEMNYDYTAGRSIDHDERDGCWNIDFFERGNGVYPYYFLTFEICLGQDERIFLTEDPDYFWMQDDAFVKMVRHDTKGGYRITEVRVID